LRSLPLVPHGLKAQEPRAKPAGWHKVTPKPADGIAG
jgi:hypothetical protein